MTLPGPMGLSMRDRAAEAEVRAGLAAVETGLLEATKSDVPFITEAAQRLVRRGRRTAPPAVPAAAGTAARPCASAPARPR